MSHFFMSQSPREGGCQARMGQCPIFLFFFFFEGIPKKSTDSKHRKYHKNHCKEKLFFHLRGFGGLLTINDHLKLQSFLEMPSDISLRTQIKENPFSLKDGSSVHSGNFHNIL